MGFSFGNEKRVTLKHGLLLAPMAGVSDHPFRAICRSLGAEYTVSEMVSAKSLCYERRSHRASVGEKSKTAPLATVWEDDVPMAVQLFGSEPEYMAEAAAMVAEGSYAGCYGSATPTAIDINMGCPMQKIVGNGEGSALLKNVSLAGRIIRAVCDAVSIPVTVKIRIGWDAEHINALDMAKEAEQSGAALICVHGRTREQMYRPGVDLETIAAVKNAVTIPVIANGDIMCAADALKTFHVTGCDGIMVARGAMGNPWIFQEITAALDGQPFTPPTLEEKLKTALHQMRMMIKEKGEHNGFSESKKQLAWYIHGVHGAAQVRGALMLATSPEQVEDLLNSLMEQNME